MNDKMAPLPKEKYSHSFCCGLWSKNVYLICLIIKCVILFFSIYLELYYYNKTIEGGISRP